MTRQRTPKPVQNALFIVMISLFIAAMGAVAWLFLSVLRIAMG